MASIEPTPLQIIAPAEPHVRRGGGRRVLRKVALAVLIVGFAAVAWAVYSGEAGLSIQVQALPAPG